jgi:hypothetical protein
MNKLKLKEANQERVIYLYQPEGRGAFGEICATNNDDEVKILIRADEDETGYYGRMACTKVKEFLEKKNLSMEYTQAWY